MGKYLHQITSNKTEVQNMNINWKQKLSSRKLWAALVGVVVGVAMAFGLDENEYAQIAGIVTSAVSVVGYIFGEAMVDAAKITDAVPTDDNLEE